MILNSLYPSAQLDINSTWIKIETTYSFKKDKNQSICCLFNSLRWKELKRSAFLTAKYHNPKLFIFSTPSCKREN